MADPKPWAVLVWIAGDNNLDDAGAADIGEMKDVGSSDAVDIVVQFDRMGDGETRRYHLRKDTSLEEDVVERLGETNTGDPAVAIDFFGWAIEQWPSEKVLAVMWNHGSGIDEADVYASARALVGRGDLTENTLRGQFRAVASSGHKRALFSTTVEKALTTRGIAYDDSARDFLDNVELKRVLEEVTVRTGRPIDVLGFDACLMNMVEVAYQLKGLVANIVGSEETEPGAGWPYADVLRALQASPELAPQEFASGIVQNYLDSYPGDEGVTQSAFAVDRSENVARAVDNLAGACIPALDNFEEYVAFDKATKNAQRFFMKDFVDLGDLCAQMIERSSNEAVKAAARAVVEELNGASPFVIATGNKGPSVDRSSGAAIYLPILGDVTVAYDNLDFAQDTRWNDLIMRYQKS